MDMEEWRRRNHGKESVKVWGMRYGQRGCWLATPQGESLGCESFLGSGGAYLTLCLNSWKRAWNENDLVACVDHMYVHGIVHVHMHTYHFRSYNFMIALGKHSCSCVSIISHPTKHIVIPNNAESILVPSHEIDQTF